MTSSEKGTPKHVHMCRHVLADRLDKTPLWFLPGVWSDILSSLKNSLTHWLHMINRSHIIASNFKCLFNEHVTYTVNKKICRSF